MTGVLRKEEIWMQIYTQEKTPLEDEGRDLSDASPSQGTADTASKPPGAGGAAWSRFSQIGRAHV